MKQVLTPRADSIGQNGSVGFMQWVQMRIAEGAAAWNLSPQMVMVILVVPFLVAASGVVAALMGKEAYKWLTQEDGFAETLQVLFYSLAFILALFVTRRQWQESRQWMALLYLGFCAGLFFLIGEELNWGQRIFGWSTSESFAEINKQGETNLHNIYGVGATFKWVQMLVGAYGTLLPLVPLFWRIPARWQKVFSLLVPHYTLVPYFGLLFVWRLYRNLVPDLQAFYFVIAEYNEVMELALAMGLFLFTVFQLRRSNHRHDYEFAIHEEPNVSQFS